MLPLRLHGACPCAITLSKRCTDTPRHSALLVTRQTIRYLVQHNMVDVLITTAGGIEEDIMKCITPHYLGHFSKFKGPELRRRGINRIGNLLVPNDNYCSFEDFMSVRMHASPHSLAGCRFLPTKPSHSHLASMPTDAHRCHTGLQPILNEMMDEQERDGKIWTPSAMIHRLGERINNEESVYYW